MVNYQKCLYSPMPVNENGFRFEILPGQSLTAIATALHAEGVLNGPRYLTWAGRLQGVAGRIKTGEYQISVGQTPSQLLSMIVKGEVVQYGITIVEGWTFQEMMVVVDAEPNLAHLLKGMKAEQIMERIGYPGMHPEGRFLPDTYHFPKGTTDIEFLKRVYLALEQTLEQAWNERALDLPLKDSYEALIMASIIEKETGLATERRAISGVFNRRLKKRMRLQTDPTVIYGLGNQFDGNLRRKDLVSMSPYNTYRIDGLPPTPIALPGREAIVAALHPDEGDSLYFVARGNGSHIFTSDLRQHNNAVIKYQLGGKPKPFSSMPKVSKKRK